MIYCAGYSENQTLPFSAVGVFWGAFDPPTAAHIEIISACLKKLPITQLIVIVNNHHYKKYTFSLQDRIQLLESMLSSSDRMKIELVWQDDLNQIDYAELRRRTDGDLYAISGYDSYKSWTKYSTESERLLYKAIVVIPRGNDHPFLYDKNAILLPIDPCYQHISSTQWKQDALFHPKTR
jgi:cytidyltransferase-like protein